MADEKAESPVYALRITRPARRHIEQEYNRLKTATRLEIADKWRDGLSDTIRDLATLPRRRNVALEDELFQAVSPGDTLFVQLYQ